MKTKRKIIFTIAICICMLSMLFFFFGCSNDSNSNTENKNENNTPTTDNITIEDAQKAISATLKATYYTVESSKTVKTEYTITNPFDKDIEVSVDIGADIYTHNIPANTKLVESIWDNKALTPTNIKLKKMTDTTIDYVALRKQIFDSLRFVEQQNSNTQAPQYAVYAKNPLNQEILLQLKVKNSFTTTTTFMAANKEVQLATVGTNSTSDIQLDILGIFDNYAQQNQQIQNAIHFEHFAREANTIENSVEFTNPLQKTCELLLKVIYPDNTIEEKITLSPKSSYNKSFNSSQKANFTIEVLSIL